MEQEQRESRRVWVYYLVSLYMALFPYAKRVRDFKYYTIKKNYNFKCFFTFVRYS